MSRKFGILSLLAASLAASPAFAQGTQKDLLPKPPTAPLEVKPLPPDDGVERERAPRPAGAGGRTLVVNRFEFAGNTLFSSAELENVVASYLNRPVTLLDILEAGDKVADFYVSKGYSLASVNVPPQKVEGGIVRLLVSEGRLARVTAEGADSYSVGRLNTYLGDIVPGTIYRGGELGESMRVINTLPGLTARAIVRPGERYGTSDLVLKLSEKRVAGALIVDNAGRENIGEFRTSAFIQLNNPLGVADQLQLLGLASEDGLLHYGYAAYSVPVNTGGTRLELSYGQAEFEIAGAPVDGINRSGKVALLHPLIATRTDQLSLSTGVARTYSTADLVSGASSASIGGTSVTVLELAAAYTRTHSNLSVSQLNVTAASNFDEQTREDLILASFSGDDSVEADQRLRLELDLQHLHPIGAGLQLFGRLNGVYSPDPLPDTSQYSLGGPNSVRGYPTSEVRGDQGYLVTLAVQRPIGMSWGSVTPRLFADAGQVFAVDACPSTDIPATAGDDRVTACIPDDEELASVGIGADASWKTRVSMKLDWAFPLGSRAVSDGRDDSRVFGSLSVNF